MGGLPGPGTLKLVFSAISFGGLAVSLFFYTGSTRVRVPVKPKLKKSLNFSHKLVVHMHTASSSRDRLIQALALCQLRCAGLFMSKWVGGFTRSRLSLIRVPHLNKNSRPCMNHVCVCHRKGSCLLSIYARTRRRLSLLTRCLAQEHGSCLTLILTLY